MNTQVAEPSTSGLKERPRPGRIVTDSPKDDDVGNTEGIVTPLDERMRSKLAIEENADR